MRLCRRHPKERAGWNCASCRADLCPDCVAKQHGGPRATQIPVCCACGRGVEPITVHRRAALPFTHRLGRAFGFPLGAAGLIAMAFVGLVRALCSYTGMGSLFMGGSLFVVRHGLYWAFVFFIIRGVATGARRMGVFGFTDIYSDLVAPAFKGILSTAILWIPTAVYIYMTSEHGLSGFFTLSTYRDPAVWLMALLGAFYVPMALIAAATDLGFGHILNPVFIGHAIYRMGKDYFVAALSIGFVLLVGGGITALLGAAFAALPVPFVGRWIALTIGLYAPFVAAGMLGALLYVHGEVLDWGRSEEYRVLVLPGVEPRGHVRPRPEERPAPPPAKAAIANPAVAAAPSPSVVPLALGPDIVSASLSSVLDLRMAPPVEAQAPVPKSEDKLPSLLKFGIVLSPSVLNAQAFVAPEDPASVDSPKAEARPRTGRPPPVAPVPAVPAPAPAPVAHTPAAYPASPAGPVTAFVEPRPGPLNISAAPTVHGFSPALPLATEAPPTQVGRASVQPFPTDENKEKKG